jgi:ActD protein
MKRRGRFYGLLAEFDDPQSLLEAVRTARRKGYRKMEAYTPFSVAEVAEELGYRRGWIPAIVLLGGVVGGGGGFFMQWYAMALSYPLNIGGRPLWSWPAFIPITFELTVLGAALFGALGMLALNGLPQPYHPVFNVERFGLATQNRFFLCVEASDPHFDRERTRQFLEELRAREVFEVENP